MEIFGETIDRELHDLAARGSAHAASSAAATARPTGCATKMDRARGARRRTKTRLSLWIAFDYGGRAELVEAARRLARERGGRRRDRRGLVRARTSTRPRCPTPIS